MTFRVTPIGNNDRGSALIITVLILMAVTVLGILASRTATIELRVASHDKTHKMTWTATDAAVGGLVPELLAQNIEQRGFGATVPPFPYGPTNDLQIWNSEFYLNEICSIPSETNMDIELNGLSQTTVAISVFGDTRLTPGNAIQLPEGYHGRGKGLASGGAQIVYSIRGLGRGAANSEARVSSGWRHII